MNSNRVRLCRLDGRTHRGAIRARGPSPWRRDSDGLRRLPPPRLPQDRRGRPVRPDAAAAAAPGSQARADTARRPKAARPTPSSWSGWPAAPPPSTCGTSSPTPRRASAASSSRSTPSADGVQICEHLPKMAKVMRQGDPRPLAEPHHPVPRPGHGLHDHRQQADAGACSIPSLGSLATRLLPAEPGVPPYVTFSEIRNGSAGRPATSAPPTTRSSSRATAARRQERQGGNLPCPRHPAADRLHARRAGKPRQAAQRLRQHLQGQLDKAADLVDGLDAFHKQALEILRSDKTKKAFDLTQEKQELRERYGTERLRPGRAGGPAAGRGGRALRDHQPGRLGHARQELRGAVEDNCCRSWIRRCRR